MIEFYLINLTWFILSTLFGIWMYGRGAARGTIVAVNAATLFMSMEGRDKRLAKEFLDFVNFLGSTNKLSPPHTSNEEDK